MASIKEYDVVTLADNKRYVVTHIIEQNGISYLCLVNNESKRVMIGKEVHYGNRMQIETVLDDKETTAVLKKLFASF